MAVYRKVHVTFWSDSFVADLDDKQKLFYLYLITNERTTQLGVYEITKKQIAFDLGYTIDTVSIHLKALENQGKIKYNSQTNEIALKNWNKYNFNPSKKVQVLVDKEFERVKDKSLIEYLYSIDTVSIHNRQEEEEEEETKKELELENKIAKIPPEFRFVEEYFNVKGEIEQAQRFYDYYTSNGWKVGKNKMKCWKSAVRNWLSNKKTYQNNGSNTETSEPKFGRIPISELRDYASNPAPLRFERDNPLE